MLKDMFNIGIGNMITEAVEKLSGLDMCISEDVLASILRPQAKILWSQVEDYIFNMRTSITTESVKLQMEKESIQKEHKEELDKKDKEIEKERAEKDKYKRQLDEERKDCIRQKEWNQALVKIIKDNGLELPNDVPHTYIPPKAQPNSDNSSLPPSKNPIGYKRGYAKRPKSDRKTGGQPGHDGSTRHPEETPTHTVEYSPERCPYCDHSLESVEGKEVEKRQVVDIPEHINLDVVNHISIQKECPHCGGVSRGVFADGVNAHFSYGPRIVATVVLLCHYMNCAWNKVVAFFECIYGLHISEGTIGNILNRFALNCEEDYQKIKEVIKSGKVVHADETVITVNGIRKHVWIFVTEGAVYMVYNRSRCMDVLLEEFPYGLPESVLVTDRYAAYFNDKFKVKSHQVCLPHLVRNCRGLENKAPNCKWVKDFKDFIERAMKAHKDLSIDREKLFAELDGLLETEPKFCNPKERKTVIGFFNNMRKDKDYILRFLITEGVPHNNNVSERGLRPCKSKLKQAGTFRSEKGPEQYVKTMSIIKTCDAKGENRFEKLVSVASRIRKKPNKEESSNSEIERVMPTPSSSNGQHKIHSPKEVSS